jgi:chaperonin GroES
MLDNLRALGDRVVIKKLAPDEKTPGGLFIPKNAEDRELAWQALVIAVGPGRTLDSGKRVEPRVKKGDKVIVGKYMGTKLTIDGEEYFVVKEDDLHGVVEDG